MVRLGLLYRKLWCDIIVLSVFVWSAMLEVEEMEVAFRILLIVFAIGLIAAVLLQKGKSAGLSGAISGGAEHLFGKQKARGLDLFLERLTVALAAGFFILALVVSYFLNQ